MEKRVRISKPLQETNCEVFLYFLIKINEAKSSRKLLRSINWFRYINGTSACFLRVLIPNLIYIWFSFEKDKGKESSSERFITLQKRGRQK